MPDRCKTFSLNVQRAIALCGSPERLSVILDCNKATIYRWEKGKSRLSTRSGKIALKLAFLLGYSEIEDLFICLSDTKGSSPVSELSQPVQSGAVDEVPAPVAGPIVRYGDLLEINRLSHDCGGIDPLREQILSIKELLDLYGGMSNMLEVIDSLRSIVNCSIC